MGPLQLAAGSLFANRFEIEHAAGRGGMGTVYRARDRYSGDTIALKLLHGDKGLGSTGGSERFGREAQLLSELRHPGIVGFVAHGQTPDGQRFLAMEWLEGEDLGQRLARGPLTVQDSLTLLIQVTNALAVAHKRGIIHRDIKPTNLFLVGGDVSQVKILDFGIARRMAASHAMTRTGMVVGTPEYMAPEQARGIRELTPAADLFSLGCVLYECLAGKPPFLADNIAAVLVRILFEEPDSLELHRPGVPAALLAILGRLLAKAPEQRPADATALHAELLSLGELPEPALATAVASLKPEADSFAAQEQGLFSVVLAAPTEEVSELGATLAESAVQLTAEERQALLQALAGMGGHGDFLANGALVVTVPSLGSAQDQAMQAARAALLIKERWPDACVSMATGRGTVRGRVAVGEVVELAGRSVKTRSPSTERSSTGVWIDPLSAKLLEGRFAQTPRPDGALLFHEEHDVDASRPLLGKPTPCVGRDTELAILDAQLGACIEDSEARAVLITAPSGVGKSRLRHEFLRRVEQHEKRVTVLLGRGDFTSAAAPFAILGQAIRRCCGISGSAPLAEQRQQLRQRVGQLLAGSGQEQQSMAAFIGELSAVPFSDDEVPTLRAMRKDPKALSDRIRRAFLDWLRLECQAAPVLLVLDDLQWADALTVTLVEQALRELHSLPLCLLALARPEVHETFPRLRQSLKLQEIPLKGLSKKACERLIKQVLGKKATLAEISRAVEQAAGNALFLEETVGRAQRATRHPN